ncbi:hypothetical protein, partial [Aeromonas jandaei]|uniref:hypothetical protein n=1 Tax=Aeromonas jandaei TaxID=650 RepID=UPI003BA29AF2
PAGAAGSGSVAATAEPSQLALPLLDITMCHLGISFEQTCEQLGLSPLEQQTLSQLQEQDHPE